MAISSGYLLFGIVTLWNSLGTLNYLNVKVLLNYYFIEYDIIQYNYYITTLIMLSLTFQIITAIFCFCYSFLIKLGLFPGYLWVPDVYEGAIYPTMVFITTSIKIGLISAFLRLLYWVFILFIYCWQPILLFTSIISIFISAFNAFKQKKIKRFLAFSSIYQMGFFFLGISCGNFDGLISALLFWIIYFFTIFGIFIILLLTRYTIINRPIIYINELNGFWQVDFRACFSLSIFFLSLAGCPPFMGFWGKFIILQNLLNVSFFNITIFVLIISLLSTFYYIKLLKNCWFELPQKNKIIQVFWDFQLIEYYYVALYLWILEFFTIFFLFTVSKFKLFKYIAYATHSIFIVFSYFN